MVIVEGPFLRFFATKHVKDHILGTSPEDFFFFFFFFFLSFKLLPTESLTTLSGHLAAS